MILNSPSVKSFSFIFVFFIISSCSNNDQDLDKEKIKINIEYAKIGTQNLDLENFSSNTDCSLESPIIVSFSDEIDLASATIAVRLFSEDDSIPLTLIFLENNTVLSATHPELESNQQYILKISSTLKGARNQIFEGIDIGFSTTEGSMAITSIVSNSINLNSSSPAQNVSYNLDIDVTFSRPVNTETINNSSVRILSKSGSESLVFNFNDSKTILKITSENQLEHLNRYQLVLSSDIKGERDENFSPLTKLFYTQVDPTPKFPIISDEELLTLVQQQTFKYFWDFAHPSSGLARERNTSGDIVTIGGSGFGIMSILVGIERNFITRDEGVERLQKIVSFLGTSDRFHGVWPHWMNGHTGKVVPFSTNDNGGDLVETSFMAQGLITVRQYLDDNILAENELIDDINELLNTIEWDWYTRDGQEVLYWHWSPSVNWAMNMQIRGHNETLITYVMAATSSNHGIDYDVYNHGYARNGGMLNGKTFYDITLPLGEDRGGPLFFTHYSFLGLDPRNLSDQYAHYWEQNRSHTLINRAYCIANPKNYVGYSANNWGLTASDNHNGYSAHSPNNDLGVITPTAALSSFPYTPEESTDALEFFYYTMGDKLWGDYGFYDAFNTTEGWVANSYLAIDQGPIIVMIENHRTGLLWNLFMSAPEVQSGLTKLGFTY